MIRYAYRVCGTAANGQTWETYGIVTVDNPGQFAKALDLTQEDSFRQLTGGLAEYGFPGRGCNGPYRITQLFIKERDGT